MKNILNILLIAISMAVFLCSSPLMAKNGGGHQGQQYQQGGHHQQGHGNQGHSQKSYHNQGPGNQDYHHHNSYNHYRYNDAYRHHGYYRHYNPHYRTYYYYHPHHPEVHYYPAYVFGYPTCGDCYYDEYGNSIDLYWDGHNEPQIQLRLNLH
jgi:hypothetical protein